MLTSLTVNNFTLVEQLETEFSAGMTTITGETGAGKSLILDALSMALGDRGDTGRIRQNATKMDITAVFSLDRNQQATQWLENNDMEAGNECIIRRTLSVEGRSRGYINGQPSTMQQLQQLGELMIDIHSQHEHQSLLKHQTHRRLLDDFAGCSALAETVAQQHQQWRTINAQLLALESDTEQNQARRALLEFQVNEFNELALEKGEVKSLEKEQHLLANAEQILHNSHAALQLCNAGDQTDLLSLLNQALALLQGLPEKSPALIDAENLLDSAAIQIDEAGREIQHHIDSFEINPERLREVEERLSLIYQLARKHKIQPQLLNELHSTLNNELESISGGQGSAEVLQQSLNALETELTTSETTLSSQRKRAAKTFARAINSQLKALAMTSANLQVQLTPTESHTIQGRETVEFIISTNPGQPHNALSKIASGGELSRISLAIQVVAAQNTQIQTLVFDEVDVGVGGAVAEVVGKLLRSLGEKGQVICVTHLPQVASCAHQHLIASKITGGNTTESQLVKLNDSNRTKEIARMLGGAKITAQTLAHAEEMLNLSVK